MRRKKLLLPPVAHVISAARKQAELRLNKKENMAAEEIKRWDAVGAV
jgi:hypothetical protein